MFAGSDSCCDAAAVTLVEICGSQPGAGSARMRVSASRKSVCQGQRAGRCIVERLAVRVILPGRANSRRRRGVVAVLGVGSVSPSSALQRERLCARQAMTVQALLAL